MKDLIEKLDRAAEPSRELDALIEIELRRFQAYEVGLSDAHRAKWKPVGNQGEIEEGGTRYHAPTYTFSIDIALTLVPPHHIWQVKQGIEACAIVWMLETDYDDKPAPTGYSTTFPALALCKAALLAREQLKR